MIFYLLILCIVSVLCVPGHTSQVSISTGNDTSLYENTNSTGRFGPIWIEVHLDKIQSNVQKIKKYIGDDVNLMAIVKADAYSFGALEVAEVALSGGASWLGVATLEEALFLRNKLEHHVPILVLSYVDPIHLSVVSRHKITVTAVSLDWIKSAAEIAKEPFDFHLKLDTGLNRIGCKTLDDVRSITKIVSHSPYLNWTGAFTHFASASNVEDTFHYYKQLDLFYQFLSVIPAIESKIIHCANSAATLIQSNKPFFNMVRIGSAMYGFFYLNPALVPIPLERVSISLYSTLIVVKELDVGERVGYDGLYTVTQKQWVGTVAAGGGDGWHVRFSSNFVYIDGKRMSIIGRISLDHMMVALPKKYPVGTVVTFIENEANETVPAISDRFPTATNRIPRIYFFDGVVVSIRNILLELINFS